MKEYIVLPGSVYSNGELLDKWLKRSYQFTAALVPKEPKKKKGKPI